MHFWLRAEARKKFININLPLVDLFDTYTSTQEKKTECKLFHPVKNISLSVFVSQLFSVLPILVRYFHSGRNRRRHMLHPCLPYNSNARHDWQFPFLADQLHPTAPDGSPGSVPGPARPTPQRAGTITANSSPRLLSGYRIRGTTGAAIWTGTAPRHLTAQHWDGPLCAATDIGNSAKTWRGYGPLLLR